MDLQRLALQLRNTSKASYLNREARNLKKPELQTGRPKSDTPGKLPEVENTHPAWRTALRSLLSFSRLRLVFCDLGFNGFGGQGLVFKAEP